MKFLVETENQLPICFYYALYHLHILKMIVKLKCKAVLLETFVIESLIIRRLVNDLAKNKGVKS